MAKTLKLIIDVDAKTGEVKAINDELNKLSDNAVKADAGLKSFSSQLMAIGASVGGVIALQQAATGAFNAFRDLEAKTAGVAKTTGMSAKEIAQLRDRFREMTDSMKGFKTTDLLEIAEAAGQLGIKGVENIAKFTESMQMVSMTTELTADEAASSFARLSNSMGLPIENIENLTSAFNELSNNTTATVGDILLFSQRMSGAATTFGLTASELAGLSATMKDVGLNFELGGTAMNQVMIRMTKQTADFAKAAKLDFNTFASEIKNKPVAALKDFLSALGKLDKFKKLQVLEDLKLTGDGVSQTLLKLSSNTDLLTRNIDMSNKAFIEATSIRKEYEVASKTMNANIDSMVDKMELLGESIINDFKEPISDGIDELSELFTYMATGKGNIDGFAKSLLIFGEIATAIGLATTAMKIFNTVTKSNPLIMGATVAIAGISALIGYLSDYNTEIEKIGESFKKTANAGEDIYGNKKIGQLEALSHAFSAVYENMEDGIKKEKALARIKEQMIKLSGKEIKSVKKTTKEKKKAVKDEEKGIKGLTKLTKDELAKQVKEYEKFLQDKKKFYAKYNDEYNKATLKKYAYEQKELQEWHTKALEEAKRFSYDQKKIDKIYLKKHYALIYQEQDENLKKQLDLYAALGDKKTEIEIKQAIKRNEIYDKYGEIATKEQLAKIIELSDKEVEEQEKAVGEIAKIWKELGDDIEKSVGDALKNIIVHGHDAGKEISELFDESFKAIGDSFVDALLKGQDPIDAMSKSLGAMVGTFDKMAGGVDKIVNGIGKLAGIDINGAVSGLTGGGTVGQVATAAYAGFTLGDKGGDLINKAIGSDTKADEWGRLFPVVGHSLGMLVGEWSKKASGVIVDSLDDIKEYDIFKKKDLGGLVKSKKTKVHEASQEVLQYFEGVRKAVDAINNYFDRDWKFNIKSGKIDSKDLDKEVSKGIIGLFGKEPAGGGTGLGSSDYTTLNNHIYQATLLAHFEEYASSVDQSISESIVQAFSYETGMLDNIRANLKGTFGDLGKGIGDALDEAFKNGGFDTIENFNKNFADKILQAIANVGNNGVQVDISGIQARWEAWAQKTGNSVVEAISAGLETIAADKAQFADFTDQYFGNSLERVREKMQTALTNFNDAMQAVGENINLQNFAKLKEEALSGTNFTPENIQTWHEAQVAIENAATSTRNFVDALQGMVDKYGQVIGKFDDFIAKLRGIEVEKETKTEATLNQVLTTLANLEKSNDTQKILEYSQELLTNMQDLKASMDEKLQSVINGKTEANQAMIDEIKNTLTVGLSETMKDIADTNKAILEAQKEGDTKAMEELSAKLEGLQEDRQAMTDALQKLNTEGLTKDIAEAIQGPLDKAMAQIAERGQEKAINEQQALLAELANQTAILQAIEGTLEQANNGEGQKIVEEAITNLANTIENGPTKDAIIQLPEQITSGIQMSMEPVNNIIATLPESLTSAIQPLQESMAVIPETFAASLAPVQETIAILPESFNSSMAPVVEGMANVSTSMQTIAPEMRAGVAEAMAPVQGAISQMAGSIGALVAAEQATAGAVYAAGAQIAGAVGGLQGMLSSVQAQAAAAAQAAQAAANIGQQAVDAAAQARQAAAAAADSNATLASSMDKLSAVTNVQAQTAGAA